MTPSEGQYLLNEITGRDSDRALRMGRRYLSGDHNGVDGLKGI